MRALVASPAPPESVHERLYRLFAECRFGFRQARSASSDNEVARLGLREAIEVFGLHPRIPRAQRGRTEARRPLSKAVARARQRVPALHGSDLSRARINHDRPLGLFVLQEDEATRSAFGLPNDKGLVADELADLRHDDEGERDRLADLGARDPLVERPTARAEIGPDLGQLTGVLPPLEGEDDPHRPVAHLGGGPGVDEIGRQSLGLESNPAIGAREEQDEEYARDEAQDRDDRNQLDQGDRTNSTAFGL